MMTYTYLQMSTCVKTIISECIINSAIIVFPFSDIIREIKRGLRGLSISDFKHCL